MIDATVAKRPPISDDELIYLCLNNAPEGTDRHQVLRMIRTYKTLLYRSTGPYNVFPQPKPDVQYFRIWIRIIINNWNALNMASKKPQELKTFTSTCDKDYDRHTYKLVLKNGKALILEDYEMVRQYWYQYKDQMNCVEVLQ